MATVLRSLHPDWTITHVETFSRLIKTQQVLPPDLLITEIHIPELEGIHALAKLRRAHPDLKLVVLSSIENRTMIVDCLTAGVHGYIPKSASVEQVLRALDAVLAGEIYVPPLIADLDREPSLKIIGGVDTGHLLTPRQHEVFEMLCRGMGTKDVARALNLGVGTVRIHIASIYRALGVHDRASAVLRANGHRPNRAETVPVAASNASDLQSSQPRKFDLRPRHDPYSLGDSSFTVQRLGLCIDDVNFGRDRQLMIDINDPQIDA
ncbi:MAG: response regulator transcription factor [Rhodospirillales bacterium]|nr:response regulator transcription factor [Acetobacter sp.]